MTIYHYHVTQLQRAAGYNVVQWQAAQFRARSRIDYQDFLMIIHTIQFAIVICKVSYKRSVIARRSLVAAL